MAGVIDRGDNKVCAGVEDGCDLAVEAGKAAFVVADFLSIDPEPGAIVGRAHMKEDAGMFLGLVSEVTLIPDGAFIVEERLALGVPVGGDFEGGRFAEVIFGGELVAGLGLAVEEPAVGFLLMVKAEEAVEVRVRRWRPIGRRARLPGAYRRR